MMSQRPDRGSPSQPCSATAARLSYQDSVLTPLSNLRDCWRVEEIGSVAKNGREFPIMAVSPVRPGPGPNVFISGGVHGEEPAGVFAALVLLSERNDLLTTRFNLTVVPCLNPSGFETGTRKGATDVDLNRHFAADSKSPENIFLQDFLKRQHPEMTRDNFIAAFDLHEIDPTRADEGFSASDNPREFYLYESCAETERRIGRDMILAGSQHGTVCKWPSIYGDVAKDGLISYPEGNQNLVYAQGRQLETYMFNNHTRHAFTFETPCEWELQKRVAVHRAMCLQGLASLARFLE